MFSCQIYISGQHLKVINNCLEKIANTLNCIMLKRTVGLGEKNTLINCDIFIEYHFSNFFFLIAPEQGYSVCWEDLHMVLFSGLITCPSLLALFIIYWTENK